MESGSPPGRRERRRQATLASRPWVHSTGPRTDAGKKRSAQNGRATQKGERSIRELRAQLAPVLALVRQMIEARDSMDEVLGNKVRYRGDRK